MTDDLERRLRADAARQPGIEPPPLGAALARATRHTRPVLTALAVAASVVLVGAAATALAIETSGDGSTAAAGPGDYRVRGLLQEDSAHEPRVVTVLLDIGSCTPDPHDISVRVSSETGTSVQVTVDPHTGPAAAQVTPINDILTRDDAPATGVITPIVPVHGVPSPTQTAAATTGAPAGGGCHWTQIDGAKIHLEARPGDRRFFVDGRRLIVMDGGFPRSLHLPAGYHLSSADMPENDRLSGFVRAQNRHGDILGVDYAPPQFIRADGTVVGHVDVNGHRATVSRSSVERRLTWELDSGARVQVYSRAATPMSVAQLRAYAQQLG